MYKTIFYLTIFLTPLFLNSCMPDPTGEEEDNEMAKDTILNLPTDSLGSDSVFTINAKFIGFDLGNASHYNFQDSKGIRWDFGGCEEKDYLFAIELQQDKQNETNQGWVTNPDLKGKWFTLKYKFRNQPEYQDGPIGKIPIIIEAKKIVNPQ